MVCVQTSSIAVRLSHLYKRRFGVSRVLVLVPGCQEHPTKVEYEAS